MQRENVEKERRERKKRLLQVLREERDEDSQASQYASDTDTDTDSDEEDTVGFLGWFLQSSCMAGGQNIPCSNPINGR